MRGGGGSCLFPNSLGCPWRVEVLVVGEASPLLPYTNKSSNQLCAFPTFPDPLLQVDCLSPSSM